MAQRSASERSAIKLFDNYLHQGVDAESAIELVRASLGLSRVELEDALRSEGRLVSDQFSNSGQI